MADRTLKDEFGNAYAQRAAIENRFRECAALTLPTNLPELGQTAQAEILRSFQALGADAVRNIVNGLVVALFTPGHPWFRHKAATTLWRRDEAGRDAEAAAEQFLYAYDLVIYAQFHAMRHMAKLRTAIEQLIVIGNSLMKLTDNYRLKAFRFDQYVWKRGSDAEMLWLITKESVDPRQLTEEQIIRADIQREELTNAAQQNTLFDIFTKAARERDGRWLIRQEIKDKPVAWSVEPVNPYLAAGYVEIPGENYSRGLVEENLGDLRSFNGLSKAILDGAVAAAMLHPAVDESKGWEPKDLLKPNGVVITGGRVNGNVVDGIGFVRTEKQADFQVAMAHAAIIEKRLNKQFLMESALQPQQERVTATQIMRIARELEGALGSVYVEIAEETQRPLLNRLIYQMKRDNLLPVMPPEIEKGVTIQLLTGAEALGRQYDLERGLAAIQVLAQIPGAIQKFKLDWIVNTVLRGYQVDVRQALKSEEELEKEEQAALALQAQAAMQEQAAKTGGAVVEQAAKASMGAAA